MTNIRLEEMSVGEIQTRLIEPAHIERLLRLKAIIERELALRYTGAKRKPSTSNNSAEGGE